MDELLPSLNEVFFDWLKAPGVGSCMGGRYSLSSEGDISGAASDVA